MTNEKTELVVLGKINPVTVFTQSGGAKSIIDAIKAEVLKIDLDISTPKGRDNIKSLAYKIARSKTALDEAGKMLKSDLQKQVDLIDGERKTIRDELDSLKEQVRKPLTEFENAEKERVQKREDRISTINCMNDFSGVDATVMMIENRIKALNELFVFDWQEFQSRAQGAYLLSLKKLEEMKEARIKSDEQAAELERLRQEKIEQERIEREARIAQEAAAKAKREAEEKAAAEARAIQEKADQEKRLAEVKAAQERKAKEDAERQAEEAKAALERANLERIEAAKRAEREVKEASERAAKAERDRQEAEKLKQEAEARKREENKAHQKKINNEALQGLLSVGISEVDAKAVIMAIAKGNVPNVKIIY